jgi:hypothetical protein
MQYLIRAKDMNYKYKKKEVLTKTSEYKKTGVGNLGYHVVSWGGVRLESTWYVGH